MAVSMDLDSIIRGCGLMPRCLRSGIRVIFGG